MIKKTVVTVATISVVGLSSAFFTETIHAETINNLHNKQSEIQNQRSDIKANLSKTESKIADVLIDLEKLNKEITRTEEALKHNQKAMKSTKKEIASTEKEIEELQDAIDKRYEILKERAVSYQKSGGNIGYLEVIFGSKSFSEFVSRVSAVSKITESDQDLLEKIEADKEKIENKLSELEDMKVELEGVQQLIIDQKEENVAKKKELKKKESKLVKMKEKLKVKDERLATLEAEVKRSIEEATTPVEVETNSTSTPAAESSSLNKSEKKIGKQEKTVSTAPSRNFSSAISAGYSVTGTPYVWGGKGPGGFDCSGFVSWAYGKAGVSLPSNTGALSGVGTKVSYGNAKPGDLVFFNTYKTNGHVGIYLGGGKFIGAQNSTGVAVADMSSGYWAKKFAGHVRRVN